MGGLGRLRLQLHVLERLATVEDSVDTHFPEELVGVVRLLHMPRADSAQHPDLVALGTTLTEDLGFRAPEGARKIIGLRAFLVGNDPVHGQNESAVGVTPASRRVKLRVLGEPSDQVNSIVVHWFLPREVDTH